MDRLRKLIRELIFVTKRRPGGGATGVWRVALRTKHANRPAPEVSLGAAQ
eukprot:COSAG06_NODE_2733_length_6369_cov_4.490878_6_plen_50_part_00